jgi:D-xylonolactonase
LHTDGPIELISDGHGLLEGPVFDRDLGLIVTDATNGGVLRFTPGCSAELIIPHRRGIGGIAIHADGGLVVSGRNVAHKAITNLGAATPTNVLLSNDAASGVLGFNDLVTDARGRIYVGSMAFMAMHIGSDATAEGRPPGKLHMIDLDGSVRVVATGVILTNGLGFSPDGKRLYHSDTLRRQVTVYDVAEDGSVHDARCFARFTSGMPDGLAVDSDGNVWVALYFGGAVTAVAADGREIGSIEIPSRLATSVCFGGGDWRDLYIVTGEGQIYRSRMGAAGIPRPPARVRYK